jgi:dTMP kinase
MANLRGTLITFEGPDGSGKSTQMEALVGLLVACGHDVVEIREPGATPLGEALRELLLDTAYKGMNARAELLLYEAARAELVQDVIAPALDAGKIVVSDRFTDSTCAYQGAGRGIAMDIVHALNDFATYGIEPDITIVLGQGSAHANAQRVSNRGTLDRIELEDTDFHGRVEGYFANLPQDSERLHFVDTSGSKYETARAIIGILADAAPHIYIDGSVVDAHLAEIAAAEEAM